LPHVFSESRYASAVLEQPDVTLLLAAVSAGDRGAVDKLLPIVYDELRKHAGFMMRRERVGHTLQPTALVHEAFLRLVQQDRVQWTGRAHFFAVASNLMRRILVDHARTRLAEKRGGGADRISIEEGLGLSVGSDADVLAVDRALERLAELDPRQAEIVTLRFFGGLSVEEVATVLNMSKRAVEAEWTMIKAWLRRELSED
jgi:RNA polymerase sigma-70 factor (ECF subfamily)